MIYLEGVYEPAEDTFLLESVMQVHGDVLEIGTGSGYLSNIAVKKAKSVVASDVSDLAVKNARLNLEKKGVKVVKSDLFENIEGRYDVIIFNPPYLPCKDTYKEAISWCGGEDGRQVIKRFISKVGGYLKKNGKGYMVISSLTGLDQVMNLFKKHGLEAKVIKEKKIFFETLYALRFETSQ